MAEGSKAGEAPASSLQTESAALKVLDELHGGEPHDHEAEDDSASSSSSEFRMAELEPSQIRWFWAKSDSNQALEIPNRHELGVFARTDSANLESAYRSRQEELDRLWWKEVAEETASNKKEKGKDAGKAKANGGARDGEAGKGDSSSEACTDTNLLDPNNPQVKVDPSNVWELDDECQDDEYTCVMVRGGYQEVELGTRCLKWCYWPGTRHRVIRGSWFVDWGSKNIWTPVRENLADQLEEAYRNEVWERKIGRTKDGDVEGVRVDLTAVENSGLYAFMASHKEMYLCQQNTINRMWMGIRGVRAPGDRLRRGWATEKMTDQNEIKEHDEHEYTARTKVASLVLVTHGIGQTLHGSNIAHDSNLMRDVVRKTTRQQMGEDYGRVEVLPVQWRKNLALDVDTLAEKIMPHGIKSLRSVIHQTVVEVLFYLTPLHHRDIVLSITNNLNDVYKRFMRRNPSFDGNVNIVAHSLGSVLCYDILCHQPQLFRNLSSASDGTDMGRYMDSQAGGRSRQPRSSLDNVAPSEREAAEDIRGKELLLEAMEKEVLELKLEITAAKAASSRTPSTPLGPPADKGREGPGGLRESPSALYVDQQAQGLEESPGLRYPALIFEVDKLILLGSPLGLFLALRGVDPSKGRTLGSAGAKEVMPYGGGYGDALPAVKRMYNVYHPFDPCAYRLEPLGIIGSEKRRPAWVPFRGGKRMHIGTAEMIEDVGDNIRKAQANMFSTIASMKVNTSRWFTRRDKESEKTEEHKDDPPPTPRQLKKTKYNPLWRLTDGPEIKEKRGRGANGRLDFILQDAPTEHQYFSAILAHFGYWACEDTCLFISRAVAGLDVIEATEKRTVLGEERIETPEDQEAATAVPTRDNQPHEDTVEPKGKEQDWVEERPRTTPLYPEIKTGGYAFA